MYDHILVPTDGSTGAVEAFEHGVTIAAQFDAQLHALYVIDARIHGDRDLWSDDMWAMFKEDLEAYAVRAVNDVAQLAAEEGVPTITAIQTGIPSETILDYVTDHSIDLVVMGTHGRTGVRRFLIGSVTEKVVRNTPVPVMAVPLDTT